MIIAAVVVTFNRPELLRRALESVQAQIRQPDAVFVVSNSDDKYVLTEKTMCGAFGFSYSRNTRTQNHAGALNAAIEQIMHQFGCTTDLYFASLDDDDLWLPEYLYEVCLANTDNADILTAYLVRKNGLKENIQVIPGTPGVRDFLAGNPGIGGANIFVRLTTLLKAGCFDEALKASIDRDLFIRLLLLKPSWRIIPKHLVTAFTDNDRVRITNTVSRQKESAQLFYNKYRGMMSGEIRALYFDWSFRLFGIRQQEIEEVDIPAYQPIIKRSISFNDQKKHPLVAGFTATVPDKTRALIRELIAKKVPLDGLLLIDNISSAGEVEQVQELLESSGLNYWFISKSIWKENLDAGVYGLDVPGQSRINSVPLGRTILHHHLYKVSADFTEPVIWIIDDDITLAYFTTEVDQESDLLALINEYRDKTDALIGGISGDPPVPALGTLRVQLVDFFYSQFGEVAANKNVAGRVNRPDYYYDLSDTHTDHLEYPVYSGKTGNEDLLCIFSGKAVSRPALQQGNDVRSGKLTRRGANTLVFNRELLKNFPVVNLRMNDRYARRGDLLWALLNQTCCDQPVLEHSMSICHDRPLSLFDIDAELVKIADDIAGYAFLRVFRESMEAHGVHRFEKLLVLIRNLSTAGGQEYFLSRYLYYLRFRQVRFTMNYFRITGLLEMLSAKYPAAAELADRLGKKDLIGELERSLHAVSHTDSLRDFFVTLEDTVAAYRNHLSVLPVQPDMQAVTVFQQHRKAALEAIEAYNERIDYTPYNYRCSTPFSTNHRLLFTTSQGVFVFDTVLKRFHRILKGKFYGLTRRKEYWYASRSNEKGLRTHLRNERISDICAFRLTADLQVADLRVVLYGIPGDVHQVDFIDDTLCVPHTGYNQVIWVDHIMEHINNLPRSIETCRFTAMDMTAPSHLNSVFRYGNEVFLIAHNYTMKTGRKSQLVRLGLPAMTYTCTELYSHSAHNVFVEHDMVYHFDSNNKQFKVGDQILFEAPKLLRGLSVSRDFFYAGGSDLVFDAYERYSNSPSIYILDKKTGKMQAQIDFDGLGDIYEIRQLADADFSLSNTTNEQ